LGKPTGGLWGVYSLKPGLTASVRAEKKQGQECHSTAVVKKILQTNHLEVEPQGLALNILGAVLLGVVRKSLGFQSAGEIFVGLKLVGVRKQRNAHLFEQLLC